MPRRAPEAPSSPPHPAPADDLAVLRTRWKWAAFSQFITTFSPLLHAPDVTVTDIEDDLVHGSVRVIPRVMQRLLYTLTYDRKITLENWQSALRKQYMKRNPLLNPLGSEPHREAVESREATPEDQDTKPTPSEIPPIENDSAATPQAGLSVAASEASRAPTQEPEVNTRVHQDQAPVDWFQLPMLTKLDSLHLLTEWQFQNPTRLRTLMRDDDELATWRYEPIGYDSKKNSFWLMGGDRLWIQRVSPKPSKSRKRKRVAENQKVHQASQKAKPPKRPRTQTMPTTKLDPPPSRVGSGRAAKIQAKIKLDAQVKEFAEFTRQLNGRRSTTRLSKRPNPPSRTLGTRVSARLRGAQTSEWQAIPDDWLDEPLGTRRRPNRTNPDNEKSSQGDVQQIFGEDSDSELTELSDDSDKQEVSELSDEESPSTVTEDVDPPVEEDEPENQVDDKFIEWETICVTLEEWEHIAERFDNATHYLEKALYKFLTNEIVPEITQTLRELERKKRLENALVHRKRSSRIASIESEKEEARLAARRQIEDKEKMSRSRRLELRKQREEEERLRREQGREQRRKEREARELRRQAEIEEHGDQPSDREPEVEASTASEPSYSRAIPSKPGIAKQRLRLSTGNASYKGAKSSNDWELDCEVCRKRGVNPEDESPMMSCGKCFKWQHIACHDQADERAGRAKRNWDVVEFVCQQCRSQMFSAPEALSSSTQDHHHHFINRQNANSVPSNHHTAAYHPYFTQGYMTSQSSPPPPQSSTISTLYHAANGRYNYTQPYGDARTSGIPDRYLSSGQQYMPTHLYQPPSISFNHYQPQGGGFSSNGKAQSPYSENYDQRLPTSQHASYSDIRSSADQRSTVGSPAQIVWNISTPVAGSYTTPYQSAACSNGIPRRDNHLQTSMKPGSSSESDFNHPYPNTQFRYHSTT